MFVYSMIVKLILLELASIIQIFQIDTHARAVILFLLDQNLRSQNKIEQEGNCDPLSSQHRAQSDTYPRQFVLAFWAKVV